MASDDRIASWQILNTVVPIIAVAIAMSAVTTSFNTTAIVLTPLLLILMVLLLSRSFSLMHDCGHQSLFSSKRSNRMAAFGLSLIHGMPQHPWSRGHAFHHKHNGNWDRYRGTIRAHHTQAIRSKIYTVPMDLSRLTSSITSISGRILLPHH
jgi:omega-6 fatty acid desaturase (delta-12 desaturase)